MSDPTWIECQTCGNLMYSIHDPVMKQKIADNPQDYIYDCWMHEWDDDDE